MSTKQQINLLADYIMENVPGAPGGEDEGTGDCAVRLLKKYRAAFGEIMSEVGEPGPNYPIPLVNVYEIAKSMLDAPHEDENLPPLTHLIVAL